MSNIAIVGEAWGAEEEQERAPFVGTSGWMLTGMLTDAGIRRSDCFLTNVFNIHPPKNDLEFFCGPKEMRLAGFPPLKSGKYVHAAYECELIRLSVDLVRENPNVIIACGNTAVWALLGKTAITKLRGTTAVSTHTVTGFKVLPTYHPAAVLRQYELRHTTVMDLVKAKRESAFPEVRRPEVTIHVPETVQDLKEIVESHIRPAERLAVDIETAGKHITVIGFAWSTTEALVIPFVDRRRIGNCYWPSIQDEVAVWEIVKAVLVSPTPRKTFQNGMYDIPFLWRGYGIGVRGADEDTMLLHHALQPEALKGLGYLGSIYAGDHGAWKEARLRTDTIKRDE
jgi:DNA polymerase